jgi:hypothetical protein
MKSNLERQQATGENMRTRRKDEEEEEEREIQVKEPKLQRTLGGSAATRRRRRSRSSGARSSSSSSDKGLDKRLCSHFFTLWPVFAKKRIFKSNVRKRTGFWRFSVAKN